MVVRSETMNLASSTVCFAALHETRTQIYMRNVMQSAAHTSYSGTAHKFLLYESQHTTDFLLLYRLTCFTRSYRSDVLESGPSFDGQTTTVVVKDALFFPQTVNKSSWRVTM